MPAQFFERTPDGRRQVIAIPTNDEIDEVKGLLKATAESLSLMTQDNVAMAKRLQEMEAKVKVLEGGGGEPVVSAEAFGKLLDKAVGEGSTIFMREADIATVFAEPVKAVANADQHIEGIERLLEVWIDVANTYGDRRRVTETFLNTSPGDRDELAPRFIEFCKIFIAFGGTSRAAKNAFKAVAI